MNLRFLVLLLDLTFPIYKALVLSYCLQGSEIDQQLRFVSYVLNDCGFSVKVPEKELVKQRVGQDSSDHLYLKVESTSNARIDQTHFHDIILIYYNSNEKWIWEIAWQWRRSRTQFLFWSKEQGGALLRPFEGDYHEARSAFFAQFYSLLTQIERHLNN